MSQDQQKLLDEVFVLLEGIASLIFFKIKTFKCLNQPRRLKRGGTPQKLQTLNQCSERGIKKKEGSLYFEQRVFQLSWQIAQSSLWGLAGGDSEFIGVFLNLQQSCDACQAAALLLSVSYRGCRSVRLLRGSLRILLQCCCLLTTNWVMETGREREGERKRERALDQL